MIQSFKVLTTLAAYRVVSAVSDTAQTVAYPESAAMAPLGITKDTVNDTNQAISVAGPGEIAGLSFSDTVSTGQLVSYDSSGQGIEYTLPNTASSLTITAFLIGTLIGGSISDTGAVADVYISPFMGHIAG